MTVHYTELTKKVDRATEHSRQAPSSSSFLPTAGVYEAFGKRLLDLILTLVSLPIVIPLIAIAALLTARDGHNPFFCQIRLGKKGRPYRIWKLRTMVPGADAMLDAHLKQNADALAEWTQHQKLKRDPRITRFGALLRRTSLDELPQFWNVLRGEMSLVGPRPIIVNQRSIYPGKYCETTRPGITGPWQVMARNNSSFAERAYFDHHYSHSISLLTDLRLLGATVRVVLRGTGY